MAPGGSTHDMEQAEATHSPNTVAAYGNIGNAKRAPLGTQTLLSLNLRTNENLMPHVAMAPRGYNTQTGETIIPNNVAINGNTSLRNGRCTRSSTQTPISSNSSNNENFLRRLNTPGMFNNTGIGEATPTVTAPVVTSTPAVTDKGGRNRAENNVLRRHFKNGGAKPRIYFPPGFKRPLGDWCQEYINEMGIICRKHLPLKKENWKQLDDIDKATLYRYIVASFDVDLSQSHIKAYVDDLIKTCFRDIRHELHKCYLDIEEGQSKRENAPDWVAQDVWEVLCDRFESEKFKKKSMNNKINRGKKKVNHRRGSRSFVRHRHAQKNRDSNQEPSRIDLHRIVYFSEEKAWSSPEAQEIYGRMVELRSQQPRGEDYVPLTDEQIADQVLGVKSGYILGLGHGIVVPSSRIGGYNRVEVDELRRRAMVAESTTEDLRVRQEQEANDLRQQLDTQREQMQEQRRLLEMLMTQLQNGQGGSINQ